ncbi:MAG: 30S ribosomal protein S17 [Candidatus Delongbacteria bacterium]|nr:30S ribosomal protein S17 [Candidatus Delongbacteria bacterium]
MSKHNRKVRVGQVVSNGMEKTVVVVVVRKVKHPVYQKYYKSTKKYMAHDPGNFDILQVGDTVKIMETRPLSRHKRWVVMDVLTRAK